MLGLEADDFGLHFFSVEDDDCRFAGEPVGGFTGVYYKCGILAADVPLMGVAVDDEVVFCAFDDFGDYAGAVDHKYLFAGGFAFEGFVVYPAAKVFYRFLEEKFFAVVVAEDRDEGGALDGGEGFGGEG